MTDAELRDELVSLLLAGHETTATAVAWAIERLVRHPDALQRLHVRDRRGRRRRVHAGRHHTRPCACGPVVPIVARVLQEPMDVGGYALPTGTRVTPSIYLTNRNPRVYERPERVPPGALSRERARDLLLDPLRRRHPPLHRRVVCELEMRLMLQTMLRELDPMRPRYSAFAAASGFVRRAITLVPTAGARVVWQRR